MAPKKDPKDNNLFTNDSQPVESTEDWGDYRKLVLHELGRVDAANTQLSEQFAELDKDASTKFASFDGLKEQYDREIKHIKDRVTTAEKLIAKHTTAIAVAKAQGATWGAIGGFVSAIIVTVIGGLILMAITGNG